MEEGEAKQELKLAIDSAKGVYDTNTSSNDDVVAATNALRDALSKVTGINGVAVKKESTLANGKYFKKGQLIIIKNGKAYTATGVNIK